jgi:DNA-directed RNA polymerase subunit RPC12/RpoP
LSQQIREAVKKTEQTALLCHNCAIAASDTFETVAESCPRCGTHLGTKYRTPVVLFCLGCGEQFSEGEEYIAIIGKEISPPIPQWHVRCYKSSFAKLFGMKDTALF